MPPIGRHWSPCRVQGLSSTEVGSATRALHLVLVSPSTESVTWSVTHPRPWPQDTQQRSYFTSGLCGPLTDRACSGPGVPFSTNESAYMTRDGTLAQP